MADVSLADWDACQWTPGYSGIDLRVTPHDVLTREVDFFHFDFNRTDWQEQFVPITKEITFDGLYNGVANAVVMYFRLGLDNTTFIDTSATAPQQTHWLQAAWFVSDTSISPGSSTRAVVGHNGVDIAVEIVRDSENTVRSSERKQSEDDETDVDNEDTGIYAGHKQRLGTKKEGNDDAQALVRSSSIYHHPSLPGWFEARQMVDGLISRMGQALSSSPGELLRTIDASMNLSAQASLFGLDPQDAASLTAMLCA